MPFAAALTAAVPLIKDLLSAIFPKDKGKQEQAKKSGEVANLAKRSAEALSLLSKQLNAIHTILEHCFRADENVTSMLNVLTTNRGATLSKPDQTAIKGWWADTKKKINTIANEKNREAVKSIEDTSTKATLIKVMDTNTDEIDGFIEIWELDRLSKKLDKLADTLHDVNGIAVQTIEGIAGGLATISEAQKISVNSQKAASN